MSLSFSFSLPLLLPLFLRLPLSSPPLLSSPSPGIVSLISLVVLSYDRYSTLTLYNKRGPDYRKPLLAVGGSWLYSIFWTVPPLLGWSSYDLEGAGTSCSVSWTLRTAQSHAYIICLFIFCLGLPIVIMVYCYFRLLWAVKQVWVGGVVRAVGWGRGECVCTSWGDLQIELNLAPCRDQYQNSDQNLTKPVLCFNQDVRHASAHACCLGW